jgi:REP element-mobilizing transposase RayT
MLRASHDAFVDPRVVSNLTSLLLRTGGGAEQFEVVAYCFMPNHLHLLVEGLSDDSETS